MRLQEAQSVTATWVANSEPFLYESVSGSLKGNARASSIRFTLRNIDDSSDEFEVLIHKEKGSTEYAFKADCFQDSDDYIISMYRSPEGFVFWAETGDGHVYFKID